MCGPTPSLLLEIAFGHVLDIQLLAYPFWFPSLVLRIEEAFVLRDTEMSGFPIGLLAVFALQLVTVPTFTLAPSAAATIVASSPAAAASVA
jgi:hypothetical protein